MSKVMQRGKLYTCQCPRCQGGRPAPPEAGLVRPEPKQYGNRAERRAWAREAKRHEKLHAAARGES